MTITEKDMPQVIEDVRQRLAKFGRERNMKLELIDEASSFEDEWLFLYIRPMQDDIRVYDYAEALGKIEKELRNEGIENVFLLPDVAI